MTAKKGNLFKDLAKLFTLSEVEKVHDEGYVKGLKDAKTGYEKGRLEARKEVFELLSRLRKRFKGQYGHKTMLINFIIKKLKELSKK